MKEFIEQHQFFTFAVILTIILAVASCVFGYPKNGLGIIAPIIAAIIFESIGLIIK